MQITVMCVGKLKESYLAMAEAEYKKRLQRYCKLQIVELADQKTPDAGQEKLIAQVLETEGDAILKRIRPGAYVVALCVEAPQLSSEEFSAAIDALALEGKSELVFVIGGSLGLSEQVKARADLRLGFSKMTFPHQLMRVILLEQIYRAYKIRNHEAYHK